MSTIQNDVNLRQKFLDYGIPYDEIDKEMVEIIDVLNFHLGITTKFCCYGHRKHDRAYVVFHESVEDEKIHVLAEAVARDYSSGICFKKWMRGLYGKLASNWILEFTVGYKDPNGEAKKYHMDKTIQLLREVG